MNVTPIAIETDSIDDLPDKIDGQFTCGDSPEEIAADNLRRASFAAVAVKAYARATGDNDLSTSISDLLGDMRHLADCLGFDFDALSLRGWRHYDPETRGEL